MKENNNNAKQAVQPYVNQNNPMQQYRNYNADLHAYNVLTNDDSIKRFSKAIDDICLKIEDHSKNVSEKEAEAIRVISNTIHQYSKKMEDSSDNMEGVSEAVSKIYNTLIKNTGKFDKATNQFFEEMLKENDEFVYVSRNLKDILSKSAKTLGQVLVDSANGLKNDFAQISNMLNLRQLVSGGATLSQMRDTQHAVKVDLGLDTNQYLGLQKDLVNQNREYGNELGLSFKETVSYLSSIQEYSFRNYNQATALYKQVQVGTKYLGITNQGISSLVKAQNQANDNAYMDKQLALLSALGQDNSTAENMSDLATFIGQNSSSIMARYSGAQGMMTDALAVKSTVDSLFGDDSQFVNNLMQEIMRSSDFSQLSSGTQTLLAYTGQATNVMQQMRSGNVNFGNLIQSVLSGTSGLTNYQRTTLENLGLSDWVTVGGDYQRNQGAFAETLNKQTSVLESIDVTNEEQVKAVQKSLANEKDDRTFFEKAEDRIFNMLGIQNQNWSALLGIEQALTAGMTFFSGVVSLYTNGLLSKILLAVHEGNVARGIKDGITPSKFSGLFGGAKGAIGSKIAGLSIGNASGLWAAGGAASVATGAIWGISDAVKMQGSTGKGWLADGARGFFLGTGASNHEDNTLSTLGNAGKWTLIGAGIGTFIAPGLGTVIGGVVGGAAGLLAGLLGNSMEDNTEAVKENTKAIGRSNDSVVTNSSMAQIYAAALAKSDGEGSPGVSYTVNPPSKGMGAASTATNIPWKISSPFGPRKLSNGDASYHYGVDFGIKTGTPIGSPVRGTVYSTQYDNRNTYPRGPKNAGSGVYVMGDDGILYQFWHLSSFGVKKGDIVNPGQTIGLSGNTGYSTGPHLHFGTKVNGKWQNPIQYLTSGLFSANGDSYIGMDPTATSSASNYASSITTDGNMSYMTQESIFNSKSTPTTYSTDGKGGVGDDYAKSSDIDRLIEAITNIKDEQQDQREFLQALSGKNKFVFTM